MLRLRRRCPADRTLDGHVHLQTEGGGAYLDSVAVPKINLRIFAERSLFRCLAFFAPTPLLTVDPGTVEATQVAHAGIRWVDFKEKVVA